MADGALDGLRVLDLAGPYGNYCGKLLADLGADVVLLEPARGSESRRRAPFDTSGESLWFTYQNANKRSAVVGAAQMPDLIGGFDVLIGSGTSSWPDAWGIRLGDLLIAHPALVVTSITPFGLDGPLAHEDATDLVALAAGGLLALGGYGDGRPVRAVGDQALTGASSFAAVGTLLAVLSAEDSGRGQLVDVSIQETVTMALEHAAQYFDLQGTVRGRQTGRQRGAGAGLYPCRDGWIYLFVGGIASGRFWTRFLEWLREEGAEGVERLTGPEWEDRAYFDTEEAKADFAGVFERFAAERGKEELTREGQARGFAIAPVRTAREVVESAQLAHRDYFRPLLSASGREIIAPGAPYVLSETPWAQRRPAPRLGQHTAEVLRG